MSNETKKQAKAPGALKKPIKTKTFESKYVKYIEQPQDRTFFRGCFEVKDDNFVIRKDLTKDDVKKLKGLLKWIKSNRASPVKIVPLIFAGIIAAALVVFFTVFANPLLGNAVEKGLEAAFEAKSEVRGFNLSLIKFRISINKIVVANRDAPMTNLFEMGSIKISLKPEAVLRGKFYINEISAEAIQFGTERKTSGALPARPPKEKPEKPPKPESPPLVDLANFDAMALLDQEYDKLATPKLYDEAINFYNDTVTKWESQVDGAKAKAEELRTASAPFLNIDLSAMRDPAVIRQTVSDITAMTDTVQTAANEAAGLVSGIENDVNTARRLEQNARNAITDDINHLKSYIDLGGGSAFAALEPFIREVLSDTAEQYLDYGLMALEVLQKVKANSEAKPKTEKPKKEKKVVFKGRDVNFPVVSYPAFYLGRLASDVTVGSWKGEFDLRDISSNPDLTNKPVTLSLGLSERDGALRRDAAFKGSADFRSNATEFYNAALNGSGFEVSLGDELSGAGINGFLGDTSFTVNLAGQTGGGFLGSGDINITNARVVDPKGTLAEAVGTAVSEAGNINLGIEYIHHIDKNDEFNINTNIGDLIARALRNAAEAYAQKAMDEIERALRAKIEQYIDGRFASKEDLDALFAAARGDKAAIDNIRNSLTNKRGEVENRLRGAADDAMQQVREEAQQAVQDALRGQTPSLPNLPSGGGLRLPGR
ncbi:MAG: hypothetical protein LBU66_04360 [Treponema sp.]|jgi:uncharacterized protein (TIGR03545 family)|nr:hypothetical protein [Treponema sp.]